MKRLFFITVCLFTSTLIFAQQDKGVAPMHKFLQANADSTLILEFTSGWMVVPSYLLLSKKGDTLTCYIYRDKNSPLLNSKSQIPQGILKKMTESKRNIRLIPADINEFFSVYALNTDTIKKFWINVSALKPWSIKDDSVDGTGCPPIKKDGKVVRQNTIYDAGGIRLSLITKNQIRVLNFYAPDFYEKQCPGRAGRIAINKIGALFAAQFK